MAVLTHLETDTGTNVDISGATAIGAYTANADKLVMVDVCIDQVAGNGDYVMYVTKQIGGAGSAYVILPKTTMTAASGETAISGQSGWITVRNGDVLTCYVDGLAGDTSTPDWTTRWFELAGTDISGLATSANLQTVDDNVDAIKAKTDNLPANTATALAAIQSDLDNPAQYKADVSGLATTAHVQEVENKIDAIDITVNTIPTNPLLDTAYTAPDNAGIAAIQEKTEQLTFTAPNKVDASATVDLGTSDIAKQSTSEQILAMFAEAQIAIIGNVQDGKITAIRGNDWELVIPCELPDDAKIQMAVKSNAGMRDDQSAIFLDSTTGLIYLDKDNGNAADGSLVYADGNLTLTLAAAATAKLCAGNFRYGIQSVSAAGKVVEKYQGDFIIYNDIVKATS